MGNPSFSKPPLTITEHITLLRRRGLTITDENQAAHYLQFIGYYRLGGYLRFYEIPSSGPLNEHKCKPGITFQHVLNLYIFDRELRLLVMDAMERIEVAARTTICDHMTIKYGTGWIFDRRHFSHDHDDLVKLAEAHITKQRSGSILGHYFAKYAESDHPPSWMLREVFPFGWWSRAYGVLSCADDYNQIAKRLGIYPSQILASWLHSLSHMRNLCAHHSLLWNRITPITPSAALIDGGECKEPGKFFNHAAIIQRFLQKISPNAEWGARLFALLERYPDVPTAEMGFPSRWYNSRYWKIPAKTAVLPPLEPS